VSELEAVLWVIAPYFALSDMVSLSSYSSDAFAVLKGMVCYYGSHYVAFHYSAKSDIWIMFDDSVVLEVGSFDHVRTKCRAGTFKPTILFYEIAT